MKDVNKTGAEQGVRLTLKFVVEGRTFQSHEQYKTEAQIKQEAGLPADAELYLSICEPWQDEKLVPGEQIDLARPGIEQFFIKRTLPYILNGVKRESASQYIRGDRLRSEGNIPADEEIYLKLEKPWEDELITDDTLVNLARPGIESFESRKVDHQVIIFVNAVEKPWNKKVINFKEVVILEYGSYDTNRDIKYSVTYKNGPKENPEGIMHEHETLFVKNKMKFYVTRTNRS
jgi:hypothetical protein